VVRGVIEPQNSRRSEIQRLIYRELWQPLLRRICSFPEPVVVHDLAAAVWQEHGPLLMLYGVLEQEVYLTVKSAVRQLESDGLVRTMLRARQTGPGRAEVDTLVAPVDVLVAMVVIADLDRR